MNNGGNITIARVLGIPIIVNVSWIATMLFVTSLLALRIYPELIPADSPHRNDHLLHWAMALSSGAVFFISILLHELAHSVVAIKQGLPVKNITLFIFGGVSQISGEARRPLHEFIMALIGPLTSAMLSLIFFALWYVTGASESAPGALVLYWLFVMNLGLAIFNMAPAFPMDGGRVLRSVIWGVTGNLTRATRLATLSGRALGYLMISVGFMIFLGVLDFADPFSGAWMMLLGLFLENSARQSWFQARAMEILGRYHAEEIMNADTPTVEQDVSLRQLATLGGRRFIFFVADDQEKVLGIVTEKEVEVLRPGSDTPLTAGEVMRNTSDVPTAAPRDPGDDMLQRMEAASVWHLPVISEGKLIGVVSKENLLRLLARNLLPPVPPAPRPVT